MKEQLENVRRKLKIYNTIEFLILATGIIAIYIFYKNDTSSSKYVGFLVLMFGAFFLLIVFLVSILIKKGWNKKHKLLYKEYYVLAALNHYFDDINYMPENGLSESVIYSTHAMKYGDRYSSNDLIEGRYKNVKFTQADVHIEKEYSSEDGPSIYLTTFQGRWLIFDFNKEFKSNFMVIKKGFANSKENGLFNKKYEQVHTESQSFNKKFYIDATSEYDVFYVLTPSLMEKIERLDSQVDGDIILVFDNSKLHIGIDNRSDAFEPPSVFTKINENDVLNSVSNDIKVITDIVNELSLDNNLFREGGI